MIDIYNRLPTDLSYKQLVETNDDIENILSQIKMVLGTKPGDILGEPYYGIDINQYLFSMNYDLEQIREIIQETITQNIEYDEQKYNVSVDVDFGHDAENGSDYACINISINERKCLGVIINQKG